ncbi:MULTISPECIES: DUF6082 family protein [unclassified Streptomyces]|uniref:DUF6082 family protein n=1 Tax=unclassified Streptomyces TaxID=2593676 RepID=UPI0036EB42BE
MRPPGASRHSFLFYASGECSNREALGDASGEREGFKGMSNHVREFCILGVITLVACAGSAALTMLLTSLPAIQSTATSNAGQAYGAAAAATSVVVLTYIARTFRHQIDEARMHREVLEAQTAELCLQRESNREQHKTVQRSAEAAVRARHIKLLEMAMNDPDLMNCWPEYSPGITERQAKQFMYCNLIIAHHYMCYELGYVNDDEIEASLRHMFRNEVVRHFWEATRPARSRTAWRGGTMGKFYDVAELAYSDQLNDGGAA